MKNYSTTFALLSILIATSCSTPSAEHTHNEDVAIELNEGKKWKVNEEMTPYIIGSEKLLNSYSGSDYKQLAEQLTEQNNQLIQSCTMDGIAHDQLHNWLHPHLELVSALKQAENEDAAEQTIQELKTSFESFHTYFE